MAKPKGMLRYEEFVRRAKGTLTYDPGWARDNLTGGWRTIRPVKDAEKCIECDFCWLFCPEGCIERLTYEADLTYCKGCGICSQECKVGAIVMKREGEDDDSEPLAGRSPSASAPSRPASPGDKGGEQ